MASETESSMSTNTEQIRLQHLRDLDILDTQPENRFDRLTRLAARLFNAPIALVSLVDSDRQWFKSKIGLPISETPRSIAFCGHTVLKNDSFVVENAALDERFADNILVTGPPHIRFYAGHPIRYRDGCPLGTHAQGFVQRLHEALDIYNAEARRGYDIAFNEGILELELDKTHEISELLRQADALMYRHKFRNASRN